MREAQDNSEGRTCEVDGGASVKSTLTLSLSVALECRTDLKFLRFPHQPSRLNVFRHSRLRERVAESWRRCSLFPWPGRRDKQSTPPLPDDRTTNAIPGPQAITTTWLLVLLHCIFC